MPGGARDYQIFTAPLADDPVRELRIVDPYGAAGERARRNMVDFARMLLKQGLGVERVHIVTFDADSVDVSHPESSDMQYADMHDRWRTAFGQDVALQFIPVSKRGNRSLHDREVQATTRSGKQLTWDLGVASMG